MSEFSGKYASKYQEDGYRIVMSVIDSGRISEFASEDVPYRESEYRYFSMSKYTKGEGSKKTNRDQKKNK